MANVSRYMFQAAAGAGGGEGYFGVVFSDYEAVEDQDYNPYLWIDDNNDSSIYMSYVQRNSSSEQAPTFAKITAGGNVEYARELRVAGRDIEQTMQYDPGTATWTTIADYLTGFKFFKINESSITSTPTDIAREVYDASNNRMGQPSRFSFSRRGSQSIICGVTTFTGSKPMYAKIEHNGSNFDVVREGTGDSLNTVFSTYCDPYGSNQMINFFYRDGYHQVSRTDVTYSNLGQNDPAKKVTFGLSSGQINLSYLRASSVYFKSGTPFHFMTGADSGLVTYDRGYFTYGSSPNCTDEYRMSSASLNAYPTAITGVVDSGYNVTTIYIAISTTPFNTSPYQYLYKIDVSGSTPTIDACLRIDNAGSSSSYPGVIRKLYYDNQYDAIVAMGFAGNGSNPDAFMFRIAGDLSTSGGGSFQWTSVSAPHSITKLAESQTTESGIWGSSTSNGSDQSGTATNTTISNNAYSTSSVSL